MRGYTWLVSIGERLQARRAQVLEVAKRYGAHNVRLIGSVARGEAGPASDVDLLVDLEQGRSLLEHAALILELERLLGCKVDVATEQGLRPRVRDRVLGEAVAL
jgi:predicted nucleotidyltransferase